MKRVISHLMKQNIVMGNRLSFNVATVAKSLAFA